MVIRSKRAQMSEGLLKDTIRWDICTWKAAIALWDTCLPNVTGGNVLELGAYQGGLSLHFALKGFNVICSDINPPCQSARALHSKYSVSDRVKYDSVDALNIEYPDNSFDIVCFKSVLPSLSHRGGSIEQKKALNEVCRVLKPGGAVMFAENLSATRLHSYLRQRFVKWGSKCGYIPYDEIRSLFDSFTDLKISTHGFLSVLGRSDTQRRLLHMVDLVLDPLLNDKMKYVVVGCARKPVMTQADI